MWLWEDHSNAAQDAQFLLSIPDSAGDNAFRYSNNAWSWIRIFDKTTFPLRIESLGTNRDDARARRKHTEDPTAWPLSGRP